MATEPTKFSPPERALLQSALDSFETGIADINLAIEQYDRTRVALVAQRDEAIAKMAELRQKLGIIIPVN